MSDPTIDTTAFSDQMRGRGIDRESRAVRITNFAGSEQEQDFTQPANCQGFGRIRHFRQQTSEGWPDNPLPIVPAARALRLESAPSVLEAQLFQNAVCNWRCWYCYVDFPLLSGRDDHSSWLTADRLIELYLAAPDRPCVIDLSGGQPDLVPEWVPWMMEALRGSGLDGVYLWSDDNLSTDYFWRYLTPAERDVVSAHGMYGKVCCFKGFDAASFAFNTKAAPELFDDQFELMGRLLRETQIDLYAYVTFTTPTDADLETGMARFVDRLQELDPMLPLRTIPLEVQVFTPVHGRMTSVHERALSHQQRAIEAWNVELAARFSEANLTMDICAVELRHS